MIVKLAHESERNRRAARRRSKIKEGQRRKAGKYTSHTKFTPGSASTANKSNVGRNKTRDRTIKWPHVGIKVGKFKFYADDSTLFQTFSFRFMKCLRTFYVTCYDILPVNTDSTSKIQ